MQPGDNLQIIESKTGKQNILVVNKTTRKALQKYLGGVSLTDDDFLFKSRKGGSGCFKDDSGMVPGD